MEPSGFLFYTSVLICSLFILVMAGNYFVDASIRYSRRIGVSKYFVGLLVVAAATSSPDIATSVSGLIAGKTDVMSGVILGGLMIDLALLNGLFAVIGRRIKLETGPIKGIEYLVLGFLLFPFVLMLRGSVSRVDGILMVISFIVYIVVMWVREASSGHMKKQVQLKFIWRDALIFLLALASMLLAGRYAVFSIVILSSNLHIPVLILSMTVLAIATALPDGMAGISAIVKGKGGEVGVGESIGSTLMEVNLFMGLAAIIQPMQFDPFSTLVGIIGIFAAATFLFLILRKGVLKTWHGVVFIGLYAVYIIVEIVRAIVH